MAVRIFLTISLLVAVATAFAQEFWLNPEKYSYATGEKLVVGFKTGGDFRGQPWDPNGSRGHALKIHQIGKSLDLSDSIKPGENGNLSYSLKGDGTYLFSFESKAVFREAASEQFNQMLKDYELDALNIRRKSNTTLEPGKEYYSVMTKLIVQVGDITDDTYGKILGWPVEILTDRNPGSLKVGDQLRFKILFDGKPVFGVRAKVWNRFDNRTTIQNIYTEKDGTFETRISSPGPWMVTVMKMTPAGQPEADWQSYHGSFIFGIEN